MEVVHFSVGFVIGCAGVIAGIALARLVCGPVPNRNPPTGPQRDLCGCQQHQAGQRTVPCSGKCANQYQVRSGGSC